MGSGNGIKAAAASAAVLSTAAAVLHFSGPSIARFASSEIPKIYASLVSWLTPPYLYVVINGIIISIAASSRFQRPESEDLTGFGSGSAPAADAKQEFVVVAAETPSVDDDEEEEGEKAEYAVQAMEYMTAPAVEDKVDDDDEEEEEEVVEVEEEEEEEFVISRSSWTPKRRQTETLAEYLTESSFLTEKPLVSTRLGRRKSLKASPEAGKVLGVARPKRNDTLESTWKAITDGRAVPLTRHLKKSDTWETHHARASREEPSPPEPAMRKSETFNDRGGGRLPPTSVSPSPASRGLRKEPSMGQDDLNRRVEAFINKFNEEMRLQRQESFNHYLDMINRGSHH